MSLADTRFSTNRPALSRRAFLTATGSTLAGTAIAAAPLAIAKAAEPLPDAELLEFVRQWQEANAAYKSQLDPLEAAEERYHHIRPKRPAALKVRTSDRFNVPTVRDQGCYWYCVQAVEQLRAKPRTKREFIGTREDWLALPDGSGGPLNASERAQWAALHADVPDPVAQVRANEIIKAWEDWQADKARAKRETGLEAAEAEHDRLLEAESKLRKQIALTPAQSTLGIMLKAKVSVILWGGLEELERDLAGELEERATNETMAWSVVRDLLRHSGNVV
jgi:hypothetical protein